MKSESTVAQKIRSSLKMVIISLHRFGKQQLPLQNAAEKLQVSLADHGEKRGRIAGFDVPTEPFKLNSSPMTYAVRGRQYIAIAAGSDRFSFASPKEQK